MNFAGVKKKILHLRMNFAGVKMFLRVQIKTKIQKDSKKVSEETAC